MQMLLVLLFAKHNTNDASKSTKYKFQTEHKYFMIIRALQRLTLTIKCARATHQIAASVFLLFVEDFQQSSTHFIPFELHSKCIQCVWTRARAHTPHKQVKRTMCKMNESKCLVCIYALDHALTALFLLFVAQSRDESNEDVRADQKSSKSSRKDKWYEQKEKNKKKLRQILQWH